MTAPATLPARRNATWDTTPLLALGHDEHLRIFVLTRTPGLLQTRAVLGELNGIGFPGAGDTGDKPRAQARQTLACRGLLADPVLLDDGQQRRAEHIRQAIVAASGQGDGHHGESEAIVHAADAGLLLMTSDGAASKAAEHQDVTTACLVDLLDELVAVGEMDAQEAADLCMDLKDNRMYPGRDVTGPLDVYGCTTEPLVLTSDEWDRR